MIDLSEYHFTYEHVEKNSFIDDDVIPKYDYLLKYLYIHCTVRNQYCVHLRNCTNTYCFAYLLFVVVVFAKRKYYTLS